MDMRHRMDRPGITRLVPHRRASGRLGSVEIARLLEPEGVEAEEKAVSRQVRRPGRKHRSGGAQHPLGVAGHEAQRVRGLDREKVGRVRRQMRIEHLRRHPQPAVDRMGERVDERQLRHRPGTPFHQGVPRGFQAESGGSDEFGTGENDRGEPSERMAGHQKGIGSECRLERGCNRGQMAGDAEDGVLESRDGTSACGAVPAAEPILDHGDLSPRR